MPLNAWGAHDCEARNQPTDAVYVCPECDAEWTWYEPHRVWEQPADTALRLQVQADLAAAAEAPVEG